MTAPTLRPISSLTYGEHASLSYDSRECQHDAMAAYFRDAAERNDRVLYVSDPGRGRQRLKSFVRDGFGERVAAGAIVLEDPAFTYTLGGAFDAERMIAHYARAVRDAVDGGYSGLRVAAEMDWAQDGVGGVDGLAAYEAQLDERFARAPAIIVCQYDESAFTPERLDACVGAHAVAAEPNPLHESRFLKIDRLYGADGVRIAGEIDMSNHGAFHCVLLDEIARCKNALIDARDLRFASAQMLGSLIYAGRNLAIGRTLSVVVSRQVHRLLLLLGADKVDALDIEVA